MSIGDYIAYLSAKMDFQIFCDCAVYFGEACFLWDHPREQPARRLADKAGAP